MALHVYAGPELGAFGWSERPWYRPGRRLEAFLAELDRQGLTAAVRFAEAGPATDADLERFHDADYVAWVRRRCASGRGSLDRASQETVARTRRLLEGIAGGRVDEALAALGSTVEEWAGFLESEGLATASGGSLSLTAAGHAFLAEPTAPLGGPTYARPQVEAAARWICGAVIDATRRIAAGGMSTVFVPIAGFHHAGIRETRRYCLYNDPALAIVTALRRVKGTVAYVDVDIHFGDGVHEGFAAERRVVIADVHAGGRTPGVAARVDDTGTTLTLELGPGTEDATYLEAWEKAESFVAAAKPSFVVFVAGVDGLATDPMSDQALTPAVFREVARRVAAVAREHADGRLLVLGGGGYEPETAARAWVGMVGELLGQAR